MTPKEKLKNIDETKLPQKAIDQLALVRVYFVDETRDALKMAYPDTFEEDYATAKQHMNKLYDLIAEKYPESIKSKAAKAPEPKTPAAMAKQAAQQTVKQPKGKSTKASAGPTKRGNITVLAKEIRKEGESWNDARKRAAAMINSQKKVVVKKANKQYQKLKAYLAKHPIRKGATDVVRDAPRKALAIGKRVSKKGWKNQYGKSDGGRTYYEYRENRTDRRRSGFPYLRLGGKLHGAGQFAKGGKISDVKWANDENKRLGIWLLTSVDGNKILQMSANGRELEKNVMNYYKKKGSVAKMTYDENADEGLSWVTFSDLYQEVQSVYAKGGTAKKKSSYAKGGMMDDYTKSFGLVKVKFANPKYNYETNVSGDTTEKAAREYFVGKMFDVGVYPKENMQKVIDIEFHPKGTYAKGGMIDLFEDYENIPPNVQEILDKYQDAFMDGDYKGLHEALKEVEKKGYTFEYYLDGQAYGLRPIDVPLNQVKGYEEFAKGGKFGEDFGYHVINDEVTLKDGRKLYLTKGRYYWSNELGDDRPSGIYYVSKDGEFISKDMINFPIYAKGGKIGFEGLSKKVAARYKGKSVPAKYQKEYGKTYDAAEAKEVGNKVAAKVYRQQLAKK